MNSTSQIQHNTLLHLFLSIHHLTESLLYCTHSTQSPITQQTLQNLLCWFERQINIKGRCGKVSWTVKQQLINFNFNFLKFPSDLSAGSFSSMSGSVSCVQDAWPACTVWHVCTVWPGRNAAAACQSCMDYRRYLANFTISTIRLALWVHFLLLSALLRTAMKTI